MISASWKRDAWKEVPATARVGYLRTAEIAPGVYIGGVLVTNLQGEPELFHYTDPVQPTRIQQVIYGYSLERYCRVDIVASALIAQIADQPALFVVSDAFLLRADKHTKAPVAALIPSDETAFHEVAQYQHAGPKQVLLQATPVGGPIRVTLNHKHRHLDQVVPILCAMGQHLSPLDPLERVALALEEIATELRATREFATAGGRR